MKLSPPFSISSRLLPALRLPDGGTIQLEYSRNPGRDGRTRYKWTIDLPSGEEFSGEDLQSGCGNSRGLQSGFENLCSSLCSAAESYRSRGLEGENSNLFPPAVVEWAAENSDEISLLGMELEETPNLIEE